MSVSQTGGCSAKLPAGLLENLLSDIPLVSNPDILVDIETHDDAGVYRINEETALIVTTDFFPPLCSDARTFGRIAACNALSDVYAMGGKPLLTLNLTMFPAEGIPLEVLHDILLGGQEMVNEAGAFTMGGHTIVDSVPKYGLAVVGTVHPDCLVTNAAAKPGDVLVLTKALGAGVLIAAQRLGLADKASYEEALAQMQMLNRKGMEVMQKYHVRCATDITGFGLLGHAAKMAAASGRQLHIDTKSLPVLPGVLQLLEDGCVPGAAFRNLEFAKPCLKVNPDVELKCKMLCADAQTSGGLLMCVPAQSARAVVEEMVSGGFPYSCVMGRVSEGSGLVLE